MLIYIYIYYEIRYIHEGWMDKIGMASNRCLLKIIVSLIIINIVLIGLGTLLAIVTVFCFSVISHDRLIAKTKKIHQVTAFDTSKGTKYLMEAEINAKNLQVLIYLFRFMLHT